MNDNNTDESRHPRHLFEKKGLLTLSLFLENRPYYFKNSSMTRRDILAIPWLGAYASHVTECLHYT
ncbi:hypothetical protein HMI56_007326 [Coelomomyces lativittatus]|nr:hypothetical protein HMI56_007326 [Coelomomyces lativittatus]